MIARALVITIALVLGSAPAHAQRDELDAGRAARDAGDHAGALAHFGAAWAASAAPIARAEMALEELALSRFALAEVHATEALGFAADPGVVTLRAQLEAALRIAASHLGSLDVRATVGADIRVDGELVGSAPLTRLVRVSAGAHTVEVSLSDHETSEVEAEVTAGAIARLEVSLRAIDRRPILERSGSGDSARIVGFSALGLGGALLIAAATTLGLSVDRDSTLRGALCAPTSPSEARETRCPAQAEERGTFTDVGRATLVAGAVLAAVGLVLVLTATSTAESPPATVACAPAFELGASCTVTF